MSHVSKLETVSLHAEIGSIGMAKSDDESDPSTTVEDEHGDEHENLPTGMDSKTV